MIKEKGKQRSAILEVTLEEIAVYRTTAQRRWEREQHELIQRRERAWAVACCTAALLKEQFGAIRVVVFGSLVHNDCFTRWSDVDIAVWGISPENTFRAISAVMAIDPEFKVNLVDVGVCRPAVLAVIEQDGVEL